VLAREFQGLQPVERGQLEIGQHEVVTAALELADKLIAGGDDFDGAIRPFRRQHVADEFGIAGVVLDVEYGERDGHGVQGWKGGVEPRGGSLSMAQKAPTTFTASMNSWKLSGLTTYALAPAW
jgi:hypothetical protein